MGESRWAPRAWQCMPMRELRRECNVRGVDVRECYARGDILRRLQAHATDVKEQALRKDLSVPIDGNMMGYIGTGVFATAGTETCERDAGELVGRDGGTMAPPGVGRSPGIAMPICPEWSANQLHCECLYWGAKLDGCLDKGDVVRGLREAKDSVLPHVFHALRTRGTCQFDGAHISGGAGIDPAQWATWTWQSMPMRDLRHECKLRGVDVGQCYARCDMLRRLQAHIASNNNSNREDDIDHPSPVGESHASSAAENHGSARASAVRDRAAVLKQHTDSGVPIATYWSASELQRECLHWDVDLDGCLDKDDAVERLRATKLLVSRTLFHRLRTRGPGAFTRGRDVGDAKVARSTAYFDFDDLETFEEVEPPPDEEGLLARTPPGEHPDAGQPTRAPGKEADSLWDLMTMRDLRRECRAKGIDLSDVYNKTEVIARLQASR